MIDRTTHNRDFAVEHLLMRGGFNRETFVAVNHLIKIRTKAEHDKAESQKTVAKTFGKTSG